MLEQAHSLSASGARRAAGLPGAILVGLVAVAHLLPIWAVEYLPHVDGPTHLYNVWLLREYWTGKWPALAELYRVNHWWVPTWFGHLVLHGLTAIFPYLTAQKLFVSAYLLALPFALVYASKGVGGGSVLPLVAGFALAFNASLNIGMYMFCYSMPLVIATTAYWLRRHRSAALLEVIGLGVLCVLAYLTHIVGLTLIFISVGLITIVGLIEDRHGVPLHALTGRVSRTLLGCLPALVLFAWFALSKDSSTAEPLSVVKRITQLVMLTSLASFQLRELALTAALMLTIGGFAALLIVRRMKRLTFRPADVWLLIAAAWGGLYLTAPELIVSRDGLKGGGLIVVRLQLFPVLALVVWCSAQGTQPRLRATVAAMTGAIAIALMAVRTEAYYALSDQLAEYVESGAAMKPGSTMVPIRMRSGGNPAFAPSTIFPDLSEGLKQKILARRARQDLASSICTRGINSLYDTFAHASGYLAIRYKIFTLENMEATTGYFPLAFHASRNPHVQVGDFDAIPPDLRFADATPRVDYALVWDADHACPTTVNVRNDLARYEALPPSKPHGLARVYRRPDP